MYFITNEKGFLLAADKDFLTLMDAATIEAAQRKMLLGEMDIPTGAELWEYNHTRYQCVYEPLESLFGQLKLVRLHQEIQTETENVEEAPLFELADEPSSQPVTEPADDVQPEQEDEEILDLGLSLDSVSELETTSESQFVESSSSQQPKEELVDLLLPEEGEIRVDELDIQNEETPASPPETLSEASESAQVPTSFDLETNARQIGVSTEDYRTFLTEFYQTVQQSENELLSENETKRTQACDSISHLARVLKLPFIADQIERLRQNPSTDTYRTLLSSIETILPKEEKAKETVPASVSPDVQTTSGKESYRYGPVDLSDVKPIHFDFTIDEAARELSLPSELIEEFIFDFIKQAHEETARMIEAYRKGDLETVQKIGHLLKGTSSNLRITPLADTLYEIQFNNDIEKVPELIRNYWGHFLSLENQMQLLKNK